MRIGLVLDDNLDKTDGVQQYVLTLGRWLTARGHEVHYLVGNTRRRDLANVHSLSPTLKVKYNKNRLSTPLPAAIRPIRKLLNHKVHFDILHLQLPYSPFLAGRVLAAVPKDCAVVGTFHILPYSRSQTLASKALAAVEKSSQKRLDEVLSVSVPAQQFAAEVFKLKSRVLPNVIDISKFHRARPRYAKPNTITIIFLGRLVPRKGAIYLLKAVKILCRSHPDLHLQVLICGQGPEAKRLKTYARQHQLNQVVRFEGYIKETDKPDYLASADIAVFPSTGGESFGIVLLEAMAAGSGAVLAGDNPGYRSVIGDFPGQLFNPKKPKILARLLTSYIAHPSARQAASLRQAKLVENYDIKRVGPKILKVYQRLIAKKQKKLDNTRHGSK